MSRKIKVDAGEFILNAVSAREVSDQRMADINAAKPGKAGDR